MSSSVVSPAKRQRQDEIVRNMHGGLEEDREEVWAEGRVGQDNVLGQDQEQEHGSQEVQLRNNDPGAKRITPTPPRRLPSKKRKEAPTISVLFVEQTVGGELARRLQQVEDRLAGVTGYRVRISETSGSQLCRLLPSTNPWATGTVQDQTVIPGVRKGRTRSTATRGM